MTDFTLTLTVFVSVVPGLTAVTGQVIDVAVVFSLPAGFMSDPPPRSIMSAYSRTSVNESETV
ncbi:hypothetical protein D9M69_629460 [compost metagenome]